MNDRTSGNDDFNELAALIRAQAKGLLAWEAAAELLIGHQTWLLRADFTSRFVTVGHDGGGGYADVDYLGALRALDECQLPCSGSEASVLRIAASLASNTMVSLGQSLGSLDARNTCLVLKAIAHANGYRDAEVTLR